MTSKTGFGQVKTFLNLDFGRVGEKNNAKTDCIGFSFSEKSLVGRDRVLFTLHGLGTRIALLGR